MEWEGAQACASSRICAYMMHVSRSDMVCTRPPHVSNDRHGGDFECVQRRVRWKEGVNYRVSTFA